MTPEDIDRLEAGRELDMLVANMVIEPLSSYPSPYHKQGSCPARSCSRCESACPHYSTDIAAAWLVVEKMREGRWKHFRIEYWVDSWAVLQDYIPGVAAWGQSTRADTAPLAICRAALKAVAAEQDTPQVSVLDELRDMFGNQVIDAGLADGTIIAYDLVEPHQPEGKGK